MMLNKNLNSPVAESRRKRQVMIYFNL